MKISRKSIGLIIASASLFILGLLFHPATLNGYLLTLRDMLYDYYYITAAGTSPIYLISQFYFRLGQLSNMILASIVLIVLALILLIWGIYVIYKTR